ncbi:helix-turn-helix domain-containing protein [Rhizobium sp. SL42]|uniref:helix-turn-helix domain-containing protein n=1 Tax=Rhizobium sp. SL42 TaxID=2806346 RepID=UPI001F1D5D34|nr:AraC family transcriptional regulator [Rhizobium sp. SL42]UJW76738.1 helix-turn-helix transcriptional regulator [Rhizobium sp. SL42]
MSYQRPDGHTFSLYLQGGAGTRRLDGGALNGWPGALCIMPQGASSEWEITDAFEFVHLYVADDELRRAFTETVERDCRLMVMPEATFDHAPALAAALHRVADATRAGDALLAGEAMTEAFASLFVDPRYGGSRPIAIKSGLAPAVRRRITDYIEAHLDMQVSLAELAAIAGLSEFHLQRMFRASCGVSPHGWVQHRRLARAKTLLAGGDPIAQIASACGFSSQSHMTRVFKAMTGTTPSAYRHSVAARA